MIRGQALNHRQRTAPAGDNTGTGIKIFGNQVAHRAVGVHHRHFGGPAGEGPAHRRVSLCRHQAAGPLVLRVAAHRLLALKDRRDTLNVH